MSLENVADIYPLSSMQEGMLFHAITDSDSGVYVDQVVVSLEGDIDSNRLRLSLNEVCGQFEALKTAFIWDGVDQPLQVVRESVEFPFESLDWSRVPQSDHREHLLQLVAANKRTGFDVQEAPLLRFSLCERGEGHWFLVICFHHLILDGWSTHSLLQGILDHYSGAVKPESHFVFRDYIEWLLQQDHTAANEFWIKALAGFAEPNRIGGARRNVIRNENDESSQQNTKRLSPETTRRIKDFAQNSRVTLNTVMQAAWAVIVSQYSGGNHDVVFGSTVAGRPLELDGIERGIGSFINTLPFRTQVKSERPVTEWLQEIQAEQSIARQWEFSSLAQIQKSSEVGPNTDLFESILVFENYPASGNAKRELNVNGFEHFEQSNYPLALIVVPGEQLELILVFDNERFSNAFVEQILEHLAWVLESLVLDSSVSVGDLLALPPNQVKTLGEHWNSAVPNSEANSIVELIEQAAAKNPQAKAAVFKSESVTYEQLIRQSDQIVSKLSQAGVASNDFVAICCERSLEMVIAIVGVLRVGAAYVPLDPGYPDSHFQHVLADANPKAVLSTSEYAGKFPSGNVVVLDDVLKENDAQAEEPNDAGISGGRRQLQTPVKDDLAYMIYTSGSTGKPKGVKVTHCNLLSSTSARFEYYTNNPGRYLLLSSFAFDSSVAGIFWSLACGGTLVLPEQGLEQDMHQMVGLIESEKVTHLLCLPSLYKLILESASDGQLASLNTAIVAGEAVQPEVIGVHEQVAKSTELHNEYGPTEGTVWATACQLTRPVANESVSIGKPIPGMKVTLFSPEQRLTPIGAIGEVFLSGKGITAGYLNRDADTAKSFIQQKDAQGRSSRMYRTGDLAFVREDGELVFCGRADRQVKIRGFRIELGEIESALLNLPEILDATVTPFKSQERGPARLVAYVVPSEGSQLTSDVKGSLQSVLPSHMVPETIVALAELPRLANGKVNVNALPEPSVTADSKGYVAPITETEETLAQIWQETIGVAKVGVNDNFFSLGGDSIISIQVISRARREGLYVEPRQIARFPTIRELAHAIQAKVSQDAVAESEMEPVLSPIQRWFFDSEMPVPQHWNQSALFELPAQYSANAIDHVINASLAAHPMLRARFTKSEQGWTPALADEMHTPQVETISVDGFEPEEFSSTCSTIQSSLNLQNGPVCRAVRFVDAKNSNDRLLISTHHLVVDAVSWQILKDDICHGYQQCVEGEEVTALSETSSYSRWANALVAISESKEIDDEMSWWRQALESGFEFPESKLKQTRPSKSSFAESNYQTIVEELDPELTQTLRTHANESYNTTAQELLLTALSLTLSKWGRAGDVCINLESHGREGHAQGLDLNRTVGWFSSVYPIRFSVDCQNIETSIKQVKEQLRSVPNSGVGYGILRYLRADSELRKLPEPRLLFNFLGVENNSPENELLRPLTGSSETDRNQNNTRSNWIEINATIRNERLEVDWAYCDQLFAQETVSELAIQMIEQLKRILGHCTEAEKGYTPSDFPEAGLSQDELDDFLDDFD